MEIKTEIMEKKHIYKKECDICRLTIFQKGKALMHYASFTSVEANLGIDPKSRFAHLNHWKAYEKKKHFCHKCFDERIKPFIKSITQ